MSAVPKIEKSWTFRPPLDLKGLLQFVSREGLPIWRLLLTGFNQFFLGLIDGTIDIFGVLIRFGTGVPTAADPNGSVYVRTDPPTGTTWLYYRFAGAWVMLAGELVNSVTAGAGLVDGGTATDPVINVVAANSTIVVKPDSIEVGIISDVNVDETIATEDSVDDVELSLAAVLDALRFQARILRAIDEKVARRAGRLPFGGDDSGNAMQLSTGLLMSIDGHLADETGTLPFRED